MNARSKIAAVRICVGLLCAAMIVVCAIFIRNRNAALYYAASVIFCLCATVYCASTDEKRSVLSRVALVVAAVCAVVVLCYIVYFSTGLSERFSDFESLKEFIRASGVWGALIFIGLTVFQVVILPIPEAVTVLLGVAIYGATWSFVLSVIGTIIGSLISFALGKIFGRRLCGWMFGVEKTEKYAKILGEKGRFLFIVMLVFPAFPDDMLCMIAGITTMSYAYFTIACLLTRPVMIGITAYLGSGIIPFSGRGIPIWIGIACLLFVALKLTNEIKRAIERRRT